MQLRRFRTAANPFSERDDGLPRLTRLIASESQSNPGTDRIRPIAQRAFQFLANARETYELVIIDCAPLLGSAAASALARGADRVLLVVEGGTSVSVVKRARQQLSLLGLPLVGFVFAQRRSSPTASRAASR